MSPVSGLSRPTMLEFCKVKNAMPCLVEDQRVRILRVRIRHLVDGELAGRRIEPADRAVLVAGVPGVALRIELDGVREGAGRQLLFLHLAGARIEPADQVAELSDPPDRAVRGLDRIARALAERRHHPFLEGDLDAARAPAWRRGGCIAAGNVRRGSAVIASCWSGTPVRSIIVPINSFQPSRV